MIHRRYFLTETGEDLAKGPVTLSNHNSKMIGGGTGVLVGPVQILRSIVQFSWLRYFRRIGLMYIVDALMTILDALYPRTAPNLVSSAHLATLRHVGSGAERALRPNLIHTMYLLMYAELE